MGTLPLPSWVQILQALTVPLIAAVGAWVAIQQMRIARIKLQHDLYDRRYAVFQAVRRFLDEMVANLVVSHDILRAFVIGTADAEFLFPDDLAAYLGEMSRRARTAQSIYMTMQSLPEGSPERARATLAANEQTQWLVEQIDGLTARFRDVLKLDKHSRSPLGWLW
jgi:hypothetical protein